MFPKTNTLLKSLIMVKTNHDCTILNQVKYNSTFHKWTLDYFKNQPHYNRFVLKQPTTEVNKSVYNPIQLNTISTDELLTTFSLTNIKQLHYQIDRELESRVNDMSINQILGLMDACLSGKHQLNKNSRSFRKFIETVDELWFRKPELTASQTIQLIYYVSIFKNQSKPVVEFGLRKLINEINHLKQLNDEELSILAVATYKSGSKVVDKILRLFAYRIEKNLDTLIENPLLFVSLIKPLKKAKYHDPKLFSLLTTAFNNNNNNKVFEDVISSIHLLTYFADANYGNIDFLQKMIDSIGRIMIQDDLKHYRIKDVYSYIFSTSYLGLTPKNSNVCKIISDFMNNIFNTKEKCQKMSKELIGMCLSMWMLDCKPIQLIQFMFSKSSVAAFRMPNSHKLDNRLNLLLTCIFIEQPDLIKHHQLVEETANSMPDAKKHLGERPFMIEVFQTLQKLSNKLDIMSIEYNFCIPYLKILGLKIIKNNSKVIYIEVLDSSNCLYNTEIPNGMMKLKYRLESKLNFTVITVNRKEHVLNDPLSLELYLESLLS